nr:hypothetical protein [Tanacetum cinerariifolium]
MFTYTLKDSAWIWWNGEKACSIVNYKDLKAKFRSHLSKQKKFTKTHLAVHNIKQMDGESTRAFVTRYTDDTLHILDLPTTSKGLTEKTYTWIEAKEVAMNRAPNDHRYGFDRYNKGSFWDNNTGKKKNRDRSNYPKYLLLGRTVMHKMGIALSTIYAAIKFHTPYGIGIVSSTYGGCAQLCIPRTITVGWKPFNTKHKLNEYKHIKLVKQKKHGLGPYRNEVACKEVDELTKAGILQKVNDQTWVANPVMVRKSDKAGRCA